MIVMIDNYDSFTWNLVQLFESATSATIEVVRNDEFEVQALLASSPSAILLSPGPGTPARAGKMIPLLQANETIPTFGVCLGQQAIGEAFGGQVVRGPVPVHGKTSHLTHDGRGLFAGCPSPLEVARYHSLVVERETLPESLQVDATSDDGMVMALSHRTRPLYGVQFHPESYGSRDGARIVRNFLQLAGVTR